VRKRARGVRRPASRSFVTFACTRGSVTLQPYGTSAPDHYAGVGDKKRERVAVAQLKYCAWCLATR